MTLRQTLSYPPAMSKKSKVIWEPPLRVYQPLRESFLYLLLIRAFPHVTSFELPTVCKAGRAGIVVHYFTKYDAKSQRG